MVDDRTSTYTVVPCAEKWSDYETLDVSTMDHAHEDYHLESSVTTMMNRLIGESLEGNLDMLYNKVLKYYPCGLILALQYSIIWG